MKVNIKKGLLVVWIVVIFVLTGYPSLETPRIKEIPMDKFYHFILFFILAFLQHKIFRPFRFFLFGMIIILLAECQQLIIPGRDFEILDIVAGLVGLVAGFLILNRRNLIKDALSKT